MLPSLSYTYSPSSGYLIGGYSLVLQVWYYESGITKCDRSLLQSASGIIKCDRMLSQSVSDFITECV